MVQGGLPTKTSGKTGDFSTKQRGFMCDFVIAKLVNICTGEFDGFGCIQELKQRYSKGKIRRKIWPTSGLSLDTLW